ncbi:MAG: phage tail protein I [Verrucomicrobiota bacterium]|nr:phage tail protein I [Verrucomicrobiota bacterium]
MAHATKSLLPGAPEPGSARTNKGEYALDLSTSRIGGVPVPVNTLWNPWTCPKVCLPWLAWALNVVEWDTSWSELTQRKVIASAIAIHRFKGTVSGVKQAMAPWGLFELKEGVTPLYCDGSFPCDGSVLCDGGDVLELLCDGTVYCDGSVLCDGTNGSNSWAHYSFTLNLTDLETGETFGPGEQGIIKRLLNRVAPVTRVLRSILYKAIAFVTNSLDNSIWECSQGYELRDGEIIRDGNYNRDGGFLGDVFYCDGSVLCDGTRRCGARRVYP